MLALIACGVVWLNGPGFRWLAPIVAGHFLKKAGFQSSFLLEGSLSGGLVVRNLHLQSDAALANLTANRITPDYRFMELFQGKLGGIAVDGLHADLRLGMKTEKIHKPFDLDDLLKNLKSVRSQLRPMTIDLRNLSVNASRDGKSMMALASSNFHHAAGDDNIQLSLGAITDATGREWPAQQSTISWQADDFSINQLDPLLGLGIRNLVLRTLRNDEPTAEAEIHLDDAVLVVGTTPGFSSVQIDLREGRVSSEKIAAIFAIKIPIKATLTSLSVNVENFLTNPLAATGAMRALLEDVEWQDWKAPELSLDVGLESGRATMAASGQSLGTGFSLNADATLSDAANRFKLQALQGSYNIASVPQLIASLSEKYKQIDPAAPVPASSAAGAFSVDFKQAAPASAHVTLLVKPEDEKAVSPLTIKTNWKSDQSLTTGIEMDGIKVAADYLLEAGTYDAKIDSEKFTSSRIDPWLAIVKAQTQGAVVFSGHWSGTGDLKKNQHKGNLAIAKIEVNREGLPPLEASGGVTYDWPTQFLTNDLKIISKNQTISADAKLADGLLEISKLSWLDGKTAIAGGELKLPVPEDYSKWRETLANDKRPLSANVESQVLSLALLKNWLPAAAKLDEKSTGLLKMIVSGTYAAPEIDLLLEIKNLRSPEQPRLPPAALTVKVSGRDGNLSLEGKASTADFPPAEITASMPFRPAEWAKNPNMIPSEKLTARMDLPRIDLSRFGSLVADARKVSGFLSGNVEVAGELSKPAIKGKITITGAGIELKSDKIPPVTGIGAVVDLSLERVTISNFKASLASGTIQGGGSLTMAQGKPGTLDFRITGNHLPLVRNDSLIVRANANLRLTGPFERATLSGTAGIVDSLFYRDIELLPMGSPFTGPSAASLPKIDVAVANPGSSVPEPFRNWAINVTARTENPFFIRGNLANGYAVGNVRIGGTLGTPAPVGLITISNFKASLPFSTLHVKTGLMRFTPATGFDPILEIRGTAEPRPYRVNVLVHGRASHPQLILTSSPPLPENEIMTLLATGTTTSGLENQQTASSRAMQLLLEELRRGRFIGGKKLRPIFAMLDRIDFSLAESDPYSSDSFSTATIQLSDQWFVSAGMGAEGDTRVLGVWRISFR